MDAKKQLKEVIAEFDEAMLVTKRPDGSLHARPMMLADKEGDGRTLWFLTNLDSPKIDEVASDPHAAVVMQGSKKYASLVGRTEIRRDPTKVDALWKETWRAWFPGGKDDPTLCFIKFDADSGEYWDRSGLKGVRYALESAKAIWRGDRVDDAGGDDKHGRARL